MRARRVDTTHSTIREELREAGFSVADTSRLGSDFPDLVIGRVGFDAKIECKSPKGRKTAAERLSAGQSDFARDWKGSPVIVSYTTDDIIWRFNMLLRSKGWVK